MPAFDYHRFVNDIKTVIPDSRIATDSLRTLAYGTDASFYRLIPKVVVNTETLFVQRGQVFPARPSAIRS
jgi:D-lactate dehydrogenase